jgi:hypothetical protein
MHFILSRLPRSHRLAKAYYFLSVVKRATMQRPALNPTNTVVGGSIAVMTGGISILVRNVLERMTTSGNICVTRLQKANEKMAELDGAT